MVGTTRRSGSAILALLLIASVVAPAGAHDAADNVQADHAYAADPLFSMTSGTGLFSHNADVPTPMASTTKVMTLLVALDAIDANVVALDDDVTISFNAVNQPPGASMMLDDQDTPLQVGEVMTLEDLLFGMMIPSGNNASYAIAEHVAQGYLGSFGTVASFVSLMNEKAIDLGLTKSFFANPAGYDAPMHMTTARELARMWENGMGDAEFRRIVRPQTWVATGELGSTTKTYTMTKGGTYPGLEGHKNGITTNCKGDQDMCWVASARRIGRRVTVAGMQADGSIGGTTGDSAEVFDHAFRRLFHPDERGNSGLGTGASRQSLVCPTAGRAVTASLPVLGRTQVTSWTANVQTQSYAIAGVATAPSGSLAVTTAGQGSDVDAIALSTSRVVTATVVGTSSELQLWSIPATGAPTRLGPAVGTRTAGNAKSMELVRLSSTMFASVARSSTDQMIIKTWRVTSTTHGLTLSLLRSHAAQSSVVEVEAASAPGQIELRLVAIARNAAGAMTVRSYIVNATTGTITVKDVETLASAGSLMSMVPAPVVGLTAEIIVDKFYALGFRRSNGGLGVLYVRVLLDGTLGATSTTTTGGTITGIELATFGNSGLVTLTKLADGTLKPIVWESFRNTNGTVTAMRISDHSTSITGSEPDICATPTSSAEGDFITSLREGSPPIIRLRGWRIGDRP